MFYVPIIPLGRYLIQVDTDFEHERTRVRGTPLGVMASQTNLFRIKGKTRLRWGEVLATYAKTFVGLPLLMFGPPVLVFLGMRLLTAHHTAASMLPVWFDDGLAMTVSVGTLINILFWPIWAIRKSRGRQAITAGATGQGPLSSI